MIGNRRVLAVVPARGGSKGVPLKNIQPLMGVPLLAWVAPIVRAVPLIDRTVVSTDHAEIAAVARAAGLDVPFMRPAELSADRVPDLPVLQHALGEMERLDATRYDIVVMLQPTAPLRTAAEVRQAIEMLVGEGWDAVWTVSASDAKYHPLKQLVVEQRAIDYYDAAGASVVARQQLSTLYHRNGVAYALTRACVLDQGALKGARTGALVCSDMHISIDTRTDFKMVEWFLKDRGFVRPAGFPDVGAGAAEEGRS